jgi:transposase InsO family protein
MPWKEVTVEEERERFVSLASEGTTNISKLCRDFGISRKTGYKYLNRKRNKLDEPLQNQSRRPHKIANKTSLEIEKIIIEIRQLNPSWGGEKLHRYLLNKGYKDLPNEKTIDRILKRYGLITAEASMQHKPWTRFEHKNANDLWQMDFKGHFATQAGRCHPLTLLDDHSRYCLLIKACEQETGIVVKNALIEVFKENGLPIAMTMDNGTPWGYSGAQQHTVLTAWLIRQGIYVGHSRPKHPQTQGKLERFHRTLKLELLKYYQFDNLVDAQGGFNWWRKKYNEERPHGAIELNVPSQRYKRSEREYIEKLPAIEYEEDMLVRKVQMDGAIYLRGKAYIVGKAFYGFHVGLKPSEEDGIMNVYFCHQKVVKINLNYPVR